MVVFGIPIQFFASCSYFYSTQAYWEYKEEGAEREADLRDGRRGRTREKTKIKKNGKLAIGTGEGGGDTRG